MENIEFNNNEREKEKKERITKTLEIIFPKDNKFNEDKKINEDIKDVILDAIIIMSEDYKEKLTLNIKEMSYSEIVKDVSDLDSLTTDNNRFYIVDKVLGEATFLYGITTDKNNDSVIELNNFERLKEKITRKYLIKIARKYDDKQVENLNLLGKEFENEIKNIIEKAIFIIVAHERGHQLGLVKRNNNSTQNTNTIKDSHCNGEKGHCLMQQVMSDEELIDLTLNLLEKEKDKCLCDDCKIELKGQETEF